MLFSQNKYTKWYFNIINRASQRNISEDEYYEVHHIIPKSLGGTNDTTNLVKLTGREHFLVHWLLVKMVILQSHKTSMRYAFVRMSHVSHTTSERYKINSYQYNIIRNHLTIATSMLFRGRTRSEESNKKTSDKLKGRISPTKGKPAWNKGIPMTDEAKIKSSLNLKGKPAWNKGIPASAASNIKRKLKQSNIPKPQICCPYCGKVGGKPAMLRHHFDHCKLKI
jgi:hypothetical protein